MASVTEILNPHLTYCDLFDIYCPCPKCAFSKVQKSFNNMPNTQCSGCDYCEFIKRLKGKGLITDKQIQDVIKAKTKCEGYKCQP